jgi:hypothetical protein
MVEGAAKKHVVTKRPVTKKKTVVKRRLRSRRGDDQKPLSRSVENKQFTVYD